MRHHQMTDLGMSLRQFGVDVLSTRAALLLEHLGQLLTCLALPGRDQGWVQFVLGRQVWNRLVALDRLQCKLGYELSIDARRAADAVKSRRVKSEKADAYALAEMLRTGWYTAGAREV